MTLILAFDIIVWRFAVTFDIEIPRWRLSSISTFVINIWHFLTVTVFICLYDMQNRELGKTAPETLEGLFVTMLSWHLHSGFPCYQHVWTWLIYVNVWYWRLTLMFSISTFKFEGNVDIWHWRWPLTLKFLMTVIGVYH